LASDENNIIGELEFGSSSLPSEDQQNRDNSANLDANSVNVRESIVTNFNSCLSTRFYHSSSKESEFFGTKIFEELIWQNYLPVLSMLVQASSQKRIVSDAIRAIVALVQISGNSDQHHLEKQASINALLNFSGIYNESILTTKNVQAIKALLYIYKSLPSLVKET
jgi:hypothetical protein